MFCKVCDFMNMKIQLYTTKAIILLNISLETQLFKQQNSITLIPEFLNKYMEEVESTYNLFATS